MRPADTVAAAVGGADLIVIMVATPGQLEQALFASGGAAGSLAAGSIVVVMAGGAGPAGAVRAGAQRSRGRALPRRRPADEAVLIEILRRDRGALTREDDPAFHAHGEKSPPGHGAKHSGAE